MLYSEEILKTIKSESYVSPKVEKKHFGAKGYGLIAKTEIKKDEIVSISGGVFILKLFLFGCELGNANLLWMTLPGLPEIGNTAVVIGTVKTLP